MRILLIEDVTRLRDSLVLGLRKLGFDLDATGDGEEGLWYALNHDYDVIILDIMLPRLDGISILRKLRSVGNQAGVLMLTARDSVEDKVAGLRQGADDYLVKPFSFDELVARIEALIRRQNRSVDLMLVAGTIIVDQQAKHISSGGKRLDLTAREYSTLEYLVRRKEQVVSRAEIETRIYDGHVEVMSNVVDTIIYNLRKKLEAAGEPTQIHTVRGMGYELRNGEA